MNIEEKIKNMALIRKRTCSQADVAEWSGYSRSHIANFEAGRVNNMYLYNFYLEKFGGHKDHGKKTTAQN